MMLLNLLSGMHKVTYRFYNNVKGASYLYREINNPGNGDCGFYAFGIALINLIQRELLKGNPNPIQLRILNAISTKKRRYAPSDFFNFKYNQQKPADKLLLQQLKSDLRGILYKRYVEELCYSSVIFEGNNTNTIGKSFAFMQFLELFYHYYLPTPLDKAMNVFYMSKEIRNFASSLANQLKSQTKKDDVEAEVKHAFMRDFFGEKYLEKVQIPWEKTFVDSYVSLSEDQQKAVLEFKQFKLLVEDNFYYQHPTRQIDDNSNLLTDASLCAHKMKLMKNGLHQKIKLFTHELENIEKGVLYLQIQNNGGVRVYSSCLPEGHNYDKEKAKNVLSYIRKHLEFKDELIIHSKDRHLFELFASTADDTLYNCALSNQIYSNYIEHYCKTRFGKVSTELNDKETLALAEIRELINKEWTVPNFYKKRASLYQQKAEFLLTNIQHTSVLNRALSTIGKDKIWLATHQDLNYLAETFDVNLEIFKNGKMSRCSGLMDYKRPKISINNVSNYHWTTQIQMGYSIGNFQNKYANFHDENLALTKEEIKKVLLSYTSGFRSFFGKNHAHQAKAKELIASCSQTGSTVESIMQNLRSYIDKQEYIVSNSFIQGFEYLDARYRGFENDVLNKRDIERLFANYIQTGYFRNHIAEAKKIVGWCKDPSLDIYGIMEKINTYVRNHRFNHDSHFISCVNKIKGLIENDESVSQHRLY